MLPVLYPNDRIAEKLIKKVIKFTIEKRKHRKKYKQTSKQDINVTKIVSDTKISITKIWSLSHLSIAVERYHDQGNYYKGKHLIGGLD